MGSGCLVVWLLVCCVLGVLNDCLMIVQLLGWAHGGTVWAHGWAWGDRAGWPRGNMREGRAEGRAGGRGGVWRDVCGVWG